MNNYKNIVLAADLNYIDPITTLIKSICCHNKNIRFYLIHKDYPEEWFNIINTQLNKMNCEIISATVVNDKIQEYAPTLPHITEASYYRFFIENVVDDDRALYLDSDTIVTGSLNELYHIDLKDNIIAAVPDMVLDTLDHYYKEFPDMKPYFNTGVLLFDLVQWKEAQISNQIFKLAELATNLLYGDQDILNIILKNCWLSLDYRFNYQTGHKLDFINRELPQFIIHPQKTPIIIHYTSGYKPWLKYNNDLLQITSPIPEFRHIYWQYNALSWQEVIHKNSEII